MYPAPFSAVEVRVDGTTSVHDRRAIAHDSFVSVTSAIDVSNSADRPTTSDDRRNSAAADDPRPR